MYALILVGNKMSLLPYEDNKTPKKDNSLTKLGSCKDNFCCCFDLFSKQVHFFDVVPNRKRANKYLQTAHF